MKPKKPSPTRGAGRSRYFGITHAKNEKWTKRQCLRGEHLWDEVWSTDSHDLSCDHCGLLVNIAGIDTQWVQFKPQRRGRGGGGRMKQIRFGAVKLKILLPWWNKRWKWDPLVLYTTEPGYVYDHEGD